MKKDFIKDVIIRIITVCIFLIFVIILIDLNITGHVTIIHKIRVKYIANKMNVMYLKDKYQKKFHKESCKILNNPYSGNYNFVMIDGYFEKGKNFSIYLEIVKKEKGTSRDSYSYIPINKEQKDLVSFLFLL